MIEKKILEKLKTLQEDIENYAEYLEESTYHPYEKVESFASKLKNIINEIKETEV